MTQEREELEARIAAYIDGELSPAEAARLEVFLANTDPALAEQVIGMIGDKQRVRALPKQKAPSDLAGRIMEQIERSSLLQGVENFSQPQRPWWQSRAAVAAAVILLLGGFTVIIIEAVHRPKSPFQSFATADEKARGLSEAAKEPVKKDGVGSDSMLAAGPSPVLPGGSPATPSTENLRTRGKDGQVFAERVMKAAIRDASPPEVISTITDVAREASTANETLVVSVAVRDAADQERLQALLETFIKQDPASARQQTLLRAPVINLAANSGAVGNNSLANTGSLTLNNNGAGQNTSGNMAYKNGTNGNEDNRLNGVQSGYNNNGQLQIANNNDGNYRRFDNGSNRFKDNETVTKYQSQEVKANFEQSPAQTPAPAKDAPYLVALRPAQLQQLARDFQVRTLSRANPSNGFGVTQIYAFDIADHENFRRGQDAAGQQQLAANAPRGIGGGGGSGGASARPAEMSQVESKAAAAPRAMAVQDAAAPEGTHVAGDRDQVPTKQLAGTAEERAAQRLDQAQRVGEESGAYISCVIIPETATTAALTAPFPATTPPANAVPTPPAATTPPPAPADPMAH